VLLERGLHLPLNVVETESIPVLTGLLRSGEMIAPLPLPVVETQCRSGEMSVLIDDLGIDIGRFGIVTRRNRSPSPGTQLLLSAVREAAAKLYPAVTLPITSSKPRARGRKPRPPHTESRATNL
jgi:DNA-binding transcriptional LysR family regulator